MTDIFDKAMQVGMGIEKKAREVIEELQKAGKAEAEGREGVEGAEGAEGAEGGGEGAEGEGGALPTRHAAENKVVEEGIKVLRELTSAARGIKEKLEGEIEGSGGKVLERLHVPTADDVEVIREMARIARERVEELEKRVCDLEEKAGSGKNKK
jgi:BMFP domain-containing protein YqiC